MTSGKLNEAQEAAITFVEATANASSHQRREGPEDCLSKIRSHGRVTLNFHPDRLSNDISVAESMLESGLYKSQFETRISNGSVSAHPGGERDRWERKLFGGAYHEPLSSPGERPKYGALNLFDHPHGASPRFGSCYVRLRPAVLSRCTFTYGDSHLAPHCVGTLRSFEVMLSALFEHVADHKYALGETIENDDVLMAMLQERVGEPRAATSEVVRNLDDYIEAQIHGEVRFDRDAEALVLDPSFRDSPIGTTLLKLAARTDMDVEWHTGFQLRPEALDDAFRGPMMRSLAVEICRRYGSEVLHPALIGRVACSLDNWKSLAHSWGSDAELLQLLKKLWHCLLMFGEPLET